MENTDEQKKWINLFSRVIPKRWDPNFYHLICKFFLRLVKSFRFRKFGAGDLKFSRYEM